MVRCSQWRECGRATMAKLPPSIRNFPNSGSFDNRHLSLTPLARSESHAPCPRIGSSRLRRPSAPWTRYARAAGWRPCDGPPVARRSDPLQCCCTCAPHTNVFFPTNSGHTKRQSAVQVRRPNPQVCSASSGWCTFAGGGCCRRWGLLSGVGLLPAQGALSTAP